MVLNCGRVDHTAFGVEGVVTHGHQTICARDIICTVGNSKLTAADIVVVAILVNQTCVGCYAVFIVTDLAIGILDDTLLDFGLFRLDRNIRPSGYGYIPQGVVLMITSASVCKA